MSAVRRRTERSSVEDCGTDDSRRLLASVPENCPRPFAGAEDAEQDGRKNDAAGNPNVSAKTSSTKPEESHPEVADNDHGESCGNASGEQFSVLGDRGAQL